MRMRIRIDAAARRTLDEMRRCGDDLRPVYPRECGENGNGIFRTRTF